MTTPPVRDRLRPPVAGIVATLAAIGLSELAAALISGQSLVAAVGGVVIDLQPAGAKDLVVGLFGQNDKLALEILIIVVAIGIGALLGIVGARWPMVGSAGFAAFAALGFLAALTDPTVAAAPEAGVAAIAGFAGVYSLSWLLGPPRIPDREGSPAASMPDWSRRSLLIKGGSLAAVSVVAGLAGRRLIDAARATPTTGGTVVPPPSELAQLPAGTSLDIAGITPLVMPNPAFYRIDTAIIVPNVDPTTWKLRIHGLVDRETTLTYAELVELPLVEQYVTIACVSNEVGGELVGNAKWTGVRLRDVLDLAGVQASATQLVGRSVDGWTAGMPTAWVMDPQREPLIAVKMNDELLPRLHGFPARLIVPGLYGYVSATKWLSELELTTWEGFNGYWVPLGWSKLGPILTQSRIDVPGNGQSVAAGTVGIAGIAWAPDRGVSKVEVAIDGEWRECRLAQPISKATWVQWTYAWDAPAGDHVIEVRATDGAGEVQTAQVSRPDPDGARGHHTIRVSVG